MTVLYLVLPLALVIGGAAVVAFVWAVHSGQLDDVDTPPRRILFDDDLAPPKDGAVGARPRVPTAKSLREGPATSQRVRGNCVAAPTWTGTRRE